MGNNVAARVQQHRHSEILKSIKTAVLHHPPISTPVGTALTAAEKADALSRHFEQVHKQTDHMSDPELTNSLSVERSLAAFFEAASTAKITPTTPKEIKTIILKRHPRKAPGQDNISTTELKRLSRKALAYITVLFNACLSLSDFPTP